MNQLKKAEEELRAKWKAKLYQKKGNKTSYWLPNADDVADWWLKEIHQVRLSERKAILKEIKELESRQYEAREILNHIKSNLKFNHLK